jgi:hypothetical protein
VVTFETVQQLALALPEVTAGTSYGTPALRVRGKFFARLREEGILVVKVGNDAQEALVHMRPETYFITPHYAGSAAVLVRLAQIEEAELRELLLAAWRLNVPKRLAASIP